LPAVNFVLPLPKLTACHTFGAGCQGFFATMLFGNNDT
jgi:hypothetical protein